MTKQEFDYALDEYRRSIERLCSISSTPGLIREEWQRQSEEKKRVIYELIQIEDES